MKRFVYFQPNEKNKSGGAEDCVIRAGDDGLVFKAGRNRDAWRVSRPTENVIVRNVSSGEGRMPVNCAASGCTIRR